MINSFRGEYYFLSNFYNAPVTYQGVTYQNNEAAFQAQKCVNECIKSSFATLSASDAKHFGRKVTLRNDWEQVKVAIMQEIVDAKFDQNHDLAEKLIMTGNEYLEEGNTWGDRIWGTVNGVGQNNLGKILMKTRERLIKNKEVS
jgi:ribA/ribD-fused uncharacterized protein